MHHDDALGRLTEGSGALPRLTAAELKRSRFKHERRPHSDARRTVRSRRPAACRCCSSSRAASTAIARLAQRAAEVLRELCAARSP